MIKGCLSLQPIKSHSGTLLFGHFRPTPYGRRREGTGTSCWFRDQKRLILENWLWKFRNRRAIFYKCMLLALTVGIPFPVLVLSFVLQLRCPYFANVVSNRDDKTYRVPHGRNQLTTFFLHYASWYPNVQVFESSSQRILAARIQFFILWINEELHWTQALSGSSLKSQYYLSHSIKRTLLETS